jgi:hypothetical protein
MTQAVYLLTAFAAGIIARHLKGSAPAPAPVLPPAPVAPSPLSLLFNSAPLAGFKTHLAAVGMVGLSVYLACNGQLGAAAAAGLSALATFGLRSALTDALVKILSTIAGPVPSGPFPPPSPALGVGPMMAWPVPAVPVPTREARSFTPGDPMLPYGSMPRSYVPQPPRPHIYRAPAPAEAEHPAIAS